MDTETEAWRCRERRTDRRTGRGRQKEGGAHREMENLIQRERQESGAQRQDAGREAEPQGLEQ